MHDGTIGEYDSRTECRARPRIAAGHHRRHVISAGIETWDRLSIVPKNARVCIGRKTGADRDVCRPYRKRIERRFDQRPNARVRFAVGISVEAVQLGFAFAEVDVDTCLGKSIVARDRGAKLPRINAGFFSEPSKIRRANEVPVVDELCGIAMTWVDDAQAVFSEKRGIADQPRWDRWRYHVAFKHSQREVMIRNRFIDKASTSRVHRNHSGLCTIEHEMWKQALGAVAPRHDRNRVQSPLVLCSGVSAAPS